jgi:orotate phosphoribosyltransferase
MYGLKQALIDCGAIKYGKFMLTSGKESDYYVDIKYAITKPHILSMILDKLEHFVLDVDKLAGTELGAVPLIIGLSLRTRKPCLIIRKGERLHGTKNMVIGDIKSGEKIAVIEDVTTTGGTVMRTIKILESYDAVVTKVLTVVDRCEGAAEVLKNKEVQFIPLLTAEHLLKK